MAQSDHKPLVEKLKFDPLLQMPTPPPTLAQDLNTIVQKVAHGGGNYMINQDYDGRVRLSLEFGHADSRYLRQDSGSRLGSPPLYTDNTNFPNEPGWVPRVYPNTPNIVPQPAIHPDTILPTWNDPNRMPDELLEELKAMRQNGEDVEAVIRRLMSFAEQMKDQLDQARTGGMSV